MILKQIKLTFLFSVLMSMIGLNTFAHDIEAANTDGKTIYYNWINDNTELAVTFRGNTEDEYDNEYTGVLNIPQSVVLNEVTYPVTAIGDMAFALNTGLTSVNIPDGVTSIGMVAFYGYTALSSFNMPKSLTSVIFTDNLFYECYNLTSIEVAEGNTKYDSRENCNAVIQKADNTLALGCKNTIIPNSVTAIGKDAFAGCTEMTTINIPNTVTLINSEAFFDCTSLSSVNLPDNLKTIGKHAFRDCI